MNETQKKLIKESIKKCEMDLAAIESSMVYFKKDIQRSQKEILTLEKKYELNLIVLKELKESL